MGKQVKQEFSSGGCVFKKTDEGVVWLLGKHSGYHKWVLPKGMIEAGETPEITAVREVQEEMGVAAKIIGEQPVHIEKYVYMADFKEEKHEDGPSRRVAVYQEQGGGKIQVSKTVTFYLMEWVNGDPKDHDWEMEEAGWFAGNEAVDKLDFPGEKVALAEAIKRICI